MFVIKNDAVWDKCNNWTFAWHSANDVADNLKPFYLPATNDKRLFLESIVNVNCLKNDYDEW